MTTRTTRTSRTARAGAALLTGSLAALLLGAPPATAAGRAPVTAWFLGTASGTAVPVELATGRVGPAARVEDPQSAAMSPDGRTLWFTTSGPLSLVPLDTATGTTGPGAQVRVFGPVALSGDGRTAWVGDNDEEGQEVLQRVHLATREVTDVGLGGGGAHDVALAQRGRTVVLSGYLFDGRRGLFKVRTSDGVLLDHRADPDPGVLAVSPDGRTLYASLAAGVTEVDVATWQPGRVLAPRASAHAASPDGRTLWVVDADGLRAVDLRTGRAGAVVPGSEGVGRLELAPSGDRAVVILRGPDGREPRAAQVDLVARTVEPLAVEQDADTFAVTPSQAPVAALAVRPAPAGAATRLDASASTARTGRLVRWDWRFGDGTTATTTSPRVSHVYARPGTYRVVVRVTDSTGTSVRQVHTGTQVLRNGGPEARTARSVRIS